MGRGQLAFPDRDEIPFMDTDIARGLVMPEAQPAQRPTEAPPNSTHRAAKRPNHERPRSVFGQSRTELSIHCGVRFSIESFAFFAQERV